MALTRALERRHARGEPRERARQIDARPRRTGGGARRLDGMPGAASASARCIPLSRRRPSPSRRRVVLGERDRARMLASSRSRPPRTGRRPLLAARPQGARSWLRRRRWCDTSLHDALAEEEVVIRSTRQLCSSPHRHARRVRAAREALGKPGDLLDAIGARRRVQAQLSSRHRRRYERRRAHRSRVLHVARVTAAATTNRFDPLPRHWIDMHLSHSTASSAFFRAPNSPATFSRPQIRSETACLTYGVE